MIRVRGSEGIYQIDGRVQDGTFHGRWHFSFGNYSEAAFAHFGVMRVFNDDTLSPGAVWPLHLHHEIEVVTYCAGGEFRHADERGPGGVLTQGGVQHTTVGQGMWHSEINNRMDAPMRFIQMWFHPSKKGLRPSVEQRRVDKAERTNKLLPLVSPIDKNALYIYSDAMVFSSFCRSGNTLKYHLDDGRGVYAYVLEGGPVEVGTHAVKAYGSAMVTDERTIHIKAKADAELLLVDVALKNGG
ncbi:MAG: pirin family protein [Deltaproteobacteria bacterium]|nr:pirin family protein [Deltaproteobacteria bacterium]